ncbi:MAG: hypothetical protein Q7T16_06695 [Candidatus Burarchaeum sp.]|nr:hypothetical protein [Candidatus Burarchaeum sp.]MDO8340316.1 hypothetical protein [Candidatus Burarchaeum sp.]
MVPKARHSRRGQGALEYLLTHGWALLVLALVIVILYGIGIFNPSRYVSEECVFQPGFGCASPARLHLASSSAPPVPNARFIFGVPLANNLGYDIAITKLDVTSTDFIAGGTSACSVELDPADIYLSFKTSPTGCMDWYLTDFVGGMYVSPYPALLLNGQTKNLNLVFKSSSPVGVAAGEVRELKFKITYRNCNTDVVANHGWARGSYSPADNAADLYMACAAASTSEHVLSGKMVSRVGGEISTIFVTQ